MQVSVETTQGLERKLTIQVPAEQVNLDIEKELQGIARSVKIDGFRPGKVPMKIVRKRYGADVRGDVLGKVIQRSLYEALAKESLMPAGTPEVEPKNLDDAETIEFTATFEVYPEIEVADFADISVEKATAAVVDSDVDAMLEKVRQQQKSWEKADRAAAEGDQVVIDFVGSIDGEAFEGGKAEGYALELGSGSMIPGFEEGLTGAKAGDEVELKVSFPAEYHAKHLAGKEAVFATKVQNVNVAVLPELNDEFATKFGLENASMDALRVDIRSNMDRELENALKGQVKNQVLEQLLAKNSFNVPKALVAEEKGRLADQMRQQMQLKAEDELPEAMTGGMEEQASRRVSLGLLMGEIIKKFEVKADADKVKEAVERVAAPYQQSEEVVKYYYQDKERLQEIEALVLEEQVIEKVLETATVAEKAQSFDEVMKTQGE
ncbi:trigger factor [Pelagibaculum spongiae]|uniref:Trigger factor n=1 Tax=Pelagibaculum spongiae TaxID=2080658 RepID=A0A2V1GZU3_9GAMM|nr:trigger factor [Pelagibaculum spongiae]PVZ72574.1 trigger factor [Pelagibaculum spongiae]